MKPYIRPLLLVLALPLLATAASWHKQAAPVQPVPFGVIDSLRLTITTCEEPYQPLPATLVQVLHRRNGGLVATYNGTANGDARFLLEMSDLVPGDSAYVTIHPTGFPQRDSSHRYGYQTGSSTPSAAAVGVWDLGQSIVIGCADGHDFAHGETIYVRYRPNQN